MRNLDELPHHCQEAINTFCEPLIHDPNVVGIVITGSYIHGTPDKNSDLDIFIIWEKADFRKRGNTWIHGVEVEYFFNPIQQIRWYFEEEAKKKGPHTAHLLANGWVYFQRGDHLQPLLDQANNIINAAFPPLSDSAIEIAKYGLDDLEKDWLDCLENDQQESARLVEQRLIEQCLQLFFHVHQTWIPKRKRLLNRLMELDPHFYQLLKAVLQGPFPEHIQHLLDYTANLLGGKRSEEWEFKGPLSQEIG